MTNKQALVPPPTQDTRLLGGPSSEHNAPPMVGESPPAYTASPYQGLPTFRPPPRAEPFTPPSPAVARANARSRFFKAFLVGWFLWVALGAMFGGGIEDMRDDRERHRPYPPPRVTRYDQPPSSPSSSAPVSASTIGPVIAAGDAVLRVLSPAEQESLVINIVDMPSSSSSPGSVVGPLTNQE